MASDRKFRHLVRTLDGLILVDVVVAVVGGGATIVCSISIVYQMNSPVAACGAPVAIGPMAVAVSRNSYLDEHQLTTEPNSDNHEDPHLAGSLFLSL
jgi:hypothetical protein